MPKTQQPNVSLERRTGSGTTAARAVRREGKIPGVLYGHGETTPIALEPKALAALVASGARTHVVDVNLDGKTTSVLLRAIEHDPVSHKPLSADLQRVDKGEAIFASIPVVATGNALGVRDFGGILEVVIPRVDVKGPGDKLPDTLSVDVTQLGLHGHVTAKELPLPPGVALITPPDAVVISVTAARANVSAGTETSGDGEPALVTPPSA